jgi:hypothetical protein
MHILVVSVGPNLLFYVTFLKNRPIRTKNGKPNTVFE